MRESVIAIIFDFDETLGPDTISFVLEKNNINAGSFWKEVEGMVNEGWDPPMAYMHKLILLAKNNKLDLSLNELSKIGNRLKLFPGLPEALSDLKSFIKNNPLLDKTKVKLEIYIISGGLEEVIRNTKLAKYVDGMFGCTFVYKNKSEQPTGIKSAISFTEKTRFLHGIRKGIDPHTLRTDPYRVNDYIEKNDERIPFSRMIYIGDGPSDIPCLSAIVNNGGVGIGVTAPFGTFKKGYELARGKRTTVGPYTANYQKSSDLRKVLEETILRLGLSIDIEGKKNVISAPKS